jgi:hypothetical protein
MMRAIFQIFKVYLISFFLLWGPLITTTMAEEGGGNDVSTTEPTFVPVGIPEPAVEEVTPEGGTETIGSGGREDVDRESLISVINGILIGYTVSQLMIACKKKYPIDVLIAAMSGLSYIWAEISSNIKSEEIREQMEVDYSLATKKAEGNNAHIDAVKKQRQSYIDIEDTAANKLRLQNMAVAGMALAGGIAIYQGALLFTEVSSCKAALVAAVPVEAKNGNKKCATGGIPLSDQVMTSFLKYGAPSLSTFSDADYAVTTSSLKGTKICDIARTTCITAEASIVSAHASCNLLDKPTGMFSITNNFPQFSILPMSQYVTSLISNYLPNLDKKDKNSLEKSLTHFIQTGEELILPSSQAGSNLGKLLPLGAGALMGVFTPIVKFFSLHIAEPSRRGWLFEALAVSMFAARDATEDVKSEMGNNISKLDKVIETYEAKAKANDQKAFIANAEAQRNAAKKVSARTSVSTNTDIVLSGDGSSTAPCITGTNSSAGGDQCPAIQNTPPSSNISNFIGAEGGAIVAGLNQVASAINGQSTISGASIGAGVNTAGPALAAGFKILKKGKREYIKVLKKQGKDVAKYENHQKKLNNYLAVKTGRILGAGNVDLNKLATKLGTGFQGAKTQEGKALEQNTSVTEVSGSVGGKGLKALNNGGQAKEANENDEGDFDFEFEEMKNTENEPNGPNENAGLADKTREGIPKGGITKDRDGDLFKIVTRRYKKTAYPIFFKRKRKSHFQ